MPGGWQQDTEAMMTTAVCAAKTLGAKLQNTSTSRRSNPRKHTMATQSQGSSNWGWAGLGYYADNGHVVQANLMKGLFPLAIVPPVPIDIHKLVGGRSPPDLGLFEGPTFTKP